MKRFFFLAIAAVGMTVACQKQEISNAPADPMDDGTPVPVVFGTNVSSSVTTKAALDAWTGNEDLVIYGFKTGADLSVTDATNAAYGYLVNGVKVDSPASGTTGEVTIPDTFYGKEDSYDFYGYYAAGVDGTATVEADKITVPITITGSEDILVAKADKAKDIAKAKETYTGTIDENRVYSAYSARRNVKPNLVFEHQLVRFDFELVNGSELADGVELEVTSIKIKANTENNIVINKAGTCGLENNGSAPADLSYVPVGGEELKFTNATPANKPLQGNIMVMPGQTEYPLTLTIKQSNSSEAVDSDLTISGPAVFKAGYCYLVKVKVYAQEAVVLSVTLKEWLPGGTITIDPDEEESTYTAPVTATLKAMTATSLTYTVDAPDVLAGGVRAGLSTTGDVDDVIEWKDVIAAKSASADVTFDGLTAGTEYYLHLEYKFENGAAAYESAPVAAPVTAFNKVSSWLVKDETTYNQLPAFYLAKFPYEANETNLTTGTDKLPWLAVTFTPASFLDVKVVKDGDEENPVFTDKKTYTEEKQLYTFCARELGMETLESGSYVVTINGVAFDPIVVE